MRHFYKITVAVLVSFLILLVATCEKNPNPAELKTSVDDQAKIVDLDQCRATFAACLENNPQNADLCAKAAASCAQVESGTKSCNLDAVYQAVECIEQIGEYKSAISECVEIAVAACNLSSLLGANCSQPGRDFLNSCRPDLIASQ